jgi:hypothetical protein
MVKTDVPIMAVDTTAFIIVGNTLAKIHLLIFLYLQGRHVFVAIRMGHKVLLMLPNVRATRIVREMCMSFVEEHVQILFI